MRFTWLGRGVVLLATTQAAAQGVKPHIPLPSPNRIDNQGNWTDVSNAKKYGVGA